MTDNKNQDAELIALAGRMGLHSLDAEQLRTIFQSHPFNTTPVASHESASVEVKESQIPVTDEMIAAGEEAQGLHLLGVFAYDVSEPEAIYRAMAAVAPVELVSANEDRIAALEAEIAEVRKDWAWSNTEWLETVQIQEGHIAELKSELAMRVTTKPTAAQQTANDIDPVAEPKPKAMPANALKPAPTDSRRVGG